MAKKGIRSKKMRVNEQTLRNIIRETISNIFLGEAAYGQATDKQIKLIKYYMFYVNIYCVYGFGGSSKYYATSKKDRPQYGKNFGQLFPDDDNLKKALIQTNFNISFDIAKRTIEFIQEWELTMTSNNYNPDWDALGDQEEQLINDILKYNGIQQQPKQQPPTNTQQQQNQPSLNDRFKKWSAGLMTEIQNAMSDGSVVFIPRGYLRYTPNSNSIRNNAIKMEAYAHGKLETKIKEVYDKTEDDDVINTPEDLMFCCNPDKAVMDGNINPCKVIGVKVPCVYKSIKHPIKPCALVTFESDKDSLNGQ